MNATLILGRWLYGLIFIMTGYSHFQPATIAFAQNHGVAPFLTMGSGILACLGGLSVALGYRPKAGAWMIAAFLIPVTLTMHRFWGQTDPQEAAQHWVNFMKNISLLGAALIFVAESGEGGRLMRAERGHAAGASKSSALH